MRAAFVFKQAMSYVLTEIFLISLFIFTVKNNRNERRGLAK